MKHKSLAPAISVEALELFLKAIVEQYPTDRFSAGMTTAWLPDRKVWYTSIVRYPTHTSKVVVLSRQSEASATDAMLLIMRDWRTQVGLGTRTHRDAFAEVEL